MRLTIAGTSLASKDHSHEHSVIPYILERGYYRPQVNVSTLHARVAFARPSLAGKNCSHEQSVIPAVITYIVARLPYSIFQTQYIFQPDLLHMRC